MVHLGILNERVHIKQSKLDMAHSNPQKIQVSIIICSLLTLCIEVSSHFSFLVRCLIGDGHMKNPPQK